MPEGHYPPALAEIHLPAGNSEMYCISGNTIFTAGHPEFKSVTSSSTHFKAQTKTRHSKLTLVSVPAKSPTDSTAPGQTGCAFPLHSSTFCVLAAPLNPLTASVGRYMIATESPSCAMWLWEHHTAPLCLSSYFRKEVLQSVSYIFFPQRKVLAG